MRRISLTALLALIAGLGAAPPTGAAERRMGVTYSPSAVFGVSVAELVPELADATPTGENGRVGSELVFWGYTLADGRPVNFFACANVAGVDCAERAQSICPGRTTVLQRGVGSGKIVRRRCREVTLVGPGDVRPGCVDQEVEADLAIGLVSCG